MKILNEWPPNIDAIRKRFPAVHERVLFTYGSYIYNPSGENIPDHLMVHEEVHEVQQAKMGVNEWWGKYLTDNEFLISQEIEAYHRQYEYFCRYEANHNKRYQFLLNCAKALSSPIYGRTINLAPALFRIKSGN